MEQHQKKTRIVRVCVYLTSSSTRVLRERYICLCLYGQLTNAHVMYPDSHHKTFKLQSTAPAAAAVVAAAAASAAAAKGKEK